MWGRNKDIFTKDHSVTQSVTKVFVEQPPALPRSANNQIIITNDKAGCRAAHNFARFAKTKPKCISSYTYDPESAEI